MTAGLIYYPDSNPGIRRKRHGRGFSYINTDGTRIACRQKRKQLDALAVPPAYTDVWIAPMTNAHLLATGRDAKTRKQYRYHPNWAAQRSRTKFDRIGQFGHSLPRLRRWIGTRLNGEVGEEDTAVAAILALIDRAALRPGATGYSKENGTYGATTLRSRHVTLEDETIHLSFQGKGGKPVEKTLYGGKLAKVLHACQDLPGPALVSWEDDDGTPRAVSSDALNARLEALCDTDVTAKTLRTWHGTLAAFLVAGQEDDLTIKSMAEAAAHRLHNTPAISRKSYIHPDVLNLAGLSAEDRAQVVPRVGDIGDGYRRGEEALIKFLG